MRRPTALLILVLALALGACSRQEPEVSANDQVPASMQIAESEGGEAAEGGEGGGGEAAEADATWVAEQLAFTSAPDVVPADGATLGLEIIGALPHNVVFEGFQGDAILVEGAGEGFFTGDAAIPAGTYTYYCSIAGHRAAGMEGEITVE
ncbi:plastocyanin/azurin family copper-binding protein [Euzebya sp.]|uniref:plastocyanin/azurin family copper-binding protein n=1 Tax=Euzebya sp. TaxID=1971409 RepID=UPI00351250B6